MEAASVLVVGALGMAGADFLKCWPGATGRDLPEADITNAESCRRMIAETRPRVLVNCAAATAVDWCETHRDDAMRVNADGAGHLAQACAEIGALVVQLSTDYVFDGTAAGEYAEEDAPNPLCVYAASKLEGERAVAAATPEHLIVRVGWLFGHADKSFVRAMLRRAAADDGSVRVIDDQVGCPTYSYHVAEAIGRLADAGARGTFHFTNAGPCTRLEMARHIFESAGADLARLVAIKSSELAWVAKRPARAVLSTAKYRRLTGAAPPPWRAAVDESLRRDGVTA
jgi:dTDP-4-dehydrorhamnose reductase